MKIKNRSKSERQEIQMALSYIKASFEFLKNFGYNFAGWQIEESAVLDYWLSVRFENQSIGRRVDIDYFPHGIQGQAHKSISITITKSPHLNSDHYMDFGYFLDKKSAQYDKESLDVNSQQGELPDRLKSALLSYSNLVQKYGAKILDGTMWESGLYPRWQ